MAKAAVKCRGSAEPAARWSKARGVALAGAAMVAFSSAPLGAQRGSLLLGGVPDQPRKGPDERDAWLPSGVPILPLPRPSANSEPPACSRRRPVCVHRDGTVPGGLALTALEAMESSYSRLVDVLALPEPLPDAGRGGTDALDLYLAAAEPGLRTGLDPPKLGPVDRASVFCTSGARGEVELARASTRCVGEAIAARLDAAEVPALRRGLATALWYLLSGPSAADLAAIDEWQAHPEQASLGRDASGESPGSAVFLHWLDVTHGTGSGGRLPAALLALSASETPAASLEWNNEPDALDVLRTSLGGPAALAQALGAFAVMRAFMGARDDGAHAAPLSESGDAGRVRFDWTLRSSELPRRVACSPLEPTGSTYVWLELDSSSAGGTLGFQAEWEPPAAFQWNLVKVDAEGRELGQVSVPFQESAREVEQRLVGLEQAAGVLVVGTNLGGVGASHPFDPDEAPYEPHGCTVYLVAL